ncbi:MAG: hypothetical protein IPK06_02325 [Ignavibacteriae bacterium]|nr:hypothetical protein [Ignavibacteriota bacterium]
MRNLKLLFNIIAFVFFSTYVTAQVSSINLDSKIYPYLSKLAQKGIIKYDDLVKPISRKYAAEKLIEARYNVNKLTSLQKDELEFYESEFGYEINQIKIRLSKANGLVSSNNINSIDDKKSIDSTAENMQRKGFAG